MQEIGADRAILLSESGVWHQISRTDRRTVIFAPRDDHPVAAFVHPFLAMTALVHADWSERLAFHGGAFVLDGGAWGILGGRGQGKSSTLAWLASHGYPILCDDTIITDGDVMFVGPRCLDLREESAGHFGIGEYLGVIGARERWRVALEPVAAEMPLFGWVSLEWGDQVQCHSIPIPEVFALLAKQRALHIGQEHPVAWLRAASKPARTLVRQRSWMGLDAAMTALIGALRDAGLGTPVAG